jgi:glycerate 2-kinase
MHVLIAPDKFKGTLTARQAAEAIARGWRKARPEDSLELLPISDGGDGFGRVMGELLGANPQCIQTVDAAHRSCATTWWWSGKTKTAIIESARVIGLAKLPKGKFHPFDLDTFGLGAVLCAARRARAKKIIVGIGGSATNDAGFGLARALGWKFLEQNGTVIESWTRLDRLTEIRRPQKMSQGRITVAVDVRNPLLGVHGASRVYGPQKGLRPEDFAHAELCLQRLARLLKRQLGLDFANAPGAGAAGGLGFGLMAFAGAKFQSGFELVAKHSALERRLRQADLVVTGEGAIDRTTAMGKGCGEIARRCRAQQMPCIGFGGKVVRTPEAEKMFTQSDGLTDLTTPAEAMRRPAFWLARLSAKTASNLVCKPPPHR